MRTAGLLIVLTAIGCGDDPAPPPAQQPNQPARAAAAAKAKAKAKTGKFAPKVRIEDRVTDPAERLSIRHTFRDRDFAVEATNRDPFQSFVVSQPGLGGDQNKLAKDIDKKCVRDDQFVASNYSYTNLRLVGIVAERAQRRVLMMDAGNLGHIIKKGDCVGREKAVVKDIGAGYITFSVTPEELPNGQPRAIEEHSVQLYPNQVPVGSQPDLDVPTRPNMPVVGPGQAVGPGTDADSAPVEQPPAE